MSERVTIEQGDALTVLRTMDSESVHCCVTSPPYWGLRDYGTEGQIGLEQTPEEYVAKLVAIFREVRRVLRDDGTLWLNIGDSYVANGQGQAHSNSFGGERTNRPQESGGVIYQPNAYGSRKVGLKPKDLVGIPWTLAFALRADGWYLRSDIIWSKPNPMPESVTDRPTKSHEYLFLLTKSANYYYDQEAIREPLSSLTLADSRNVNGRHTQGDDRGTKYDSENHPDLPSWYRAKTFVNPMQGRNRRSVWTIPTEPYPDAHFATYPTALVKPCILAGTSERGCCPNCGAGWVRVVEKSRTFESGSGRAEHLPAGKNGAGLQGGGATLDVRRGPTLHTQTTGWAPVCSHGLDPVPATILDCFMGSGTTGLVALQYGRRFVGVELSADYITLARKRLYAAESQLCLL